MSARVPQDLRDTAMAAFWAVAADIAKAFAASPEEQMATVRALRLDAEDPDAQQAREGGFVLAPDVALQALAKEWGVSDSDARAAFAKLV